MNFISRFRLALNMSHPADAFKLGAAVAICVILLGLLSGYIGYKLAQQSSGVTVVPAPPSYSYDYTPAPQNYMPAPEPVVMLKYCMYGPPVPMDMPCMVPQLREPPLQTQL